MLVGLPLGAQTTATSVAPPEEAAVESADAEPKTTWKNFKLTLVSKPFSAVYSRKGLEIESPGGGYTAHIQWRLQSRYVTPFDHDPRQPSQFAPISNNYYMRRARYKMEGELFHGFAEYKFEQDLLGGRMITLFTDLHPTSWLRIRVGQWKSIFSQERYISSGKQQFVERSIVNREFTLDRQAGISFNAHFGAGTRGDSVYSFEVLKGTGMNSGFGWDGSPLLVGRYQWNFLKADPGFSSSDTGNRQTPAAFVAFTAARNTSAYTRFSSGGAQLDGFTAGTANQYRLTQVNGEFLFKYRGWSIQNENHWKQVHDNVNHTDTTLRGSYVQTGYFPHTVWGFVPREVEFAYRYAVVDPNKALPGDLRQESTFAMNIFLEGHDDKWTFDFSRLSLQQNNLAGLSDFRYRIQWDVQF